MNSKVNHPQHYNQLPNDIECIEVIEWFNLNLGNVIKYVWRAEHKGQLLEDLHKAKWYLEREIARIEKMQDKPCPSLYTFEFDMPENTNPYDACTSPLNIESDDNDCVHIKVDNRTYPMYPPEPPIFDGEF
jgi:hypothetical protein